jgi:hypothetical protein
MKLSDVLLPVCLLLALWFGALKVGTVVLGPLVESTFGSAAASVGGAL